MFSLFVVWFVRFSPRRSGAPSWPVILREAALKALMMTWRQACLKVDAAEAVERPSSACGTFSSYPRALSAIATAIATAVKPTMTAPGH